jgi:hypothetical protein
VPDDVRLAPGTGRMHSARSGKINAEASAAALDILVHGWVAGNTIVGSHDAAGQLFSELTAAAIDDGLRITSSCCSRWDCSPSGRSPAPE